MSQENKTADKPDLSDVTLVPPPHVPAPPYANSTYVFIGSAFDVSVVFLRIPLLTDEQVKAFAESGNKELPGEVITSITMPKATAARLAFLLHKATEQME